MDSDAHVVAASFLPVGRVQVRLADGILILVQVPSAMIPVLTLGRL